MVEPRIEPGTSWLVVRSSDHQTTRLVERLDKNKYCIESMCFGSVVEHFNLLSRHLSGGAEKTTKNWVKIPGLFA
jgi:hypothetical protein